MMGRSLLLLLICSVAFSSCKPQVTELELLEQEVQRNPTNETVSELLNAYAEWLRENPAKASQRREILEKNLELSNTHQRFTHALTSLQGLVIDYPDDAATPDWLLQMADILDKMNKPVIANALRHELLTRHPDHEALADVQPMEISIDSLILETGQKMFDAEQRTLNMQLARQYVDLCEVYVMVHPDSAEAPEYLHRAAEAARSMRSTDKAMGLYDWLIAQYPEHKRAAQSLFLKAFTYDNELRDFDMARKYYEEFLEKYPGDEFASSAEFLLANLGKSDDELLDALQRQSTER